MKGCRKDVKNVVNSDNFVVVNLKVVKVVSNDNQKVVNLTTHRPRDNPDNPKVVSGDNVLTTL